MPHSYILHLYESSNPPLLQFCTSRTTTLLFLLHSFTPASLYLNIRTSVLAHIKRKDVDHHQLLLTVNTESYLDKTRICLHRSHPQPLNLPQIANLILKRHIPYSLSKSINVPTLSNKSHRRKVPPKQATSISSSPPLQHTLQKSPSNHASSQSQRSTPNISNRSKRGHIKQPT